MRTIRRPSFLTFALFLLIGLIVTLPGLAGAGTAVGKWRTVVDKKDGVSLELPANWYIRKPPGYSKGKPPPGAVEPKEKIDNPLLAAMFAQGEEATHVAAVGVFQDRGGGLHKTKYHMSGYAEPAVESLTSEYEHVYKTAAGTKDIESLKKMPAIRAFPMGGGKKRYWYEYLGKATAEDGPRGRHYWHSVLLLANRHLDLTMSCDPADAAKLGPVFMHIMKSVRQVK